MSFCYVHWDSLRLQSILSAITAYVKDLHVAIHYVYVIHHQKFLIS